MFCTYLLLASGEKRLTVPNPSANVVRLDDSWPDRRYRLGMLEEEYFENLFFALRQVAASPKAAPPVRLLAELESRALHRLRDVPPPNWDDGFKLAYEMSGRPLPKPVWDFTRIEEPHGLGDLVGCLTTKFNEAANQSSGWTREQKRYLRWYPAAEVLRYCAEIRERGPNPITVRCLEAAHSRMASHERLIGQKMRAKPTLEPRADTVAVLAAMRRRLKGMGTPNVSLAADQAFRFDGLGASKAANARLWHRAQKK